MKALLLPFLLVLLLSGCDTRTYLERNPDAWKEWDYSVSGMRSDSVRVTGDMTMDSKGSLTGKGTTMDENGIEGEVTVRKIGNNRMQGSDRDGRTYKFRIRPLRTGEPPHAQ